MAINHIKIWLPLTSLRKNVAAKEKNYIAHKEENQNAPDSRVKDCDVYNNFLHSGSRLFRRGKHPRVLEAGTALKAPPVGLELTTHAAAIAWQ